MNLSNKCIIDKGALQLTLNTLERGGVSHKEVAQSLREAVDDIPDTIAGLQNELDELKALSGKIEQMSLGDVIDTFMTLDPDMVIDGIGVGLDSYRGYYNQLAFPKGSATVSELLEDAKNAVGDVFTGYKGGEYIMYRDTEVWVANYSETGDMLMYIGNGKIITKPDEY